MTAKTRVLVTGAKGFLGENCCRFFKNLGFEVYGIGHSDLSEREKDEAGLDYWINSDISISSIRKFDVEFELIIHCAGSGSVGFSIENPYVDFKKTVDGTIEVLEFMRLYNINSRLIYPSSPAVQGEHPDTPILESFVGKPTSPYGYHKKMAEDLCRSYSEKFSLNIKVVRLFSVFGVGLKKQLLWDAVNKISGTNPDVEFWGTGKETRDFIHVNDALNIFYGIHKKSDSNFEIVNGGTGKKITIYEVVSKIRSILGSTRALTFNNRVDLGNPIYYCASTEILSNYVRVDFSNFDEDLSNYVRWAIEKS